MATLNDLSAIDRAHWELHLNVAIIDMPSVKVEATTYLLGAELPNIGHPSYIHDWLENHLVEAING